MMGALCRGFSTHPVWIDILRFLRRLTCALNLATSLHGVFGNGKSSVLTLGTWLGLQLLNQVTKDLKQRTPAQRESGHAANAFNVIE